MPDIQDINLPEMKQTIKLFFPDCPISDDKSVTELFVKRELFSTQKDIIPYLQTMFFEEHLVEIQIDQTTRIFFTQLEDELPEPVKDKSEIKIEIEEPDYEPGSYLKTADSFLIAPLTPALGNAQIRNSKQLVVRFFTGTIAIELGCYFSEQTIVRGIPLLRLSFPIIGRINRNFRSFRVKAIQSVDAKVCLLTSNPVKASEEYFQIVDVSSDGLAFQMPGDHLEFQLGEEIKINVAVAGAQDLEVGGNIRHISKVREAKGYKIICGMQFDLETRSLAADLEKLAAAIQRLHLREISEKTSEFEGINFIR